MKFIEWFQMQPKYSYYLPSKNLQVDKRQNLNTF